MGLTKVRIGARAAKSLQEVIDWLHTNVGEFKGRELITTGPGIGTEYTGDNWFARWRGYGAGWFMYITFNDPKHATLFILRWK